MLASQWVWQLTKSVSIPAEEQNAGRVVDYFYRMEFHITPRFFSDSNYLFFSLNKFCANLSNKALDFYTDSMLPSTHKILVVRPNSPESARNRPNSPEMRPNSPELRINSL